MRVPVPDLARRIISRALKARITEGAAALTYFETMALVPALVVSLSIASVVVDDPRATVDDLVARLGGTNKGSLASALREIVSSLSESGTASTLITIGALTAIWSISGAMSALLGITGRMLGEANERGLVRARARALALALASALAGAFALGSVVLLGGASSWLARQTDSTFLSVMLERGMYLVIVLGLAAYLVVVFRMAAAAPPRTLALAVGALVGASLFALGTIGLGAYLSTIGSSNAVAGSLAGLIVVLIWMYVSNLAILAGAAVCGELDAPPGRADECPASDAGG